MKPPSTILSWASTHGCSQLKHQRLVAERRYLNGSTILVHAPTPNLKLLTLSLDPCFALAKQGQSSGGKNCVVLRNRLTCGLLANPLQSLSLAICEIYSVREECCRQGYERVCESLLPDFIAPYAHQNDHSYMYHGVLPYAICRDDPEKKWRPP